MLHTTVYCQSHEALGVLAENTDEKKLIKSPYYVPQWGQQHNRSQSYCIFISHLCTNIVINMTTVTINAHNHSCNIPYGQ